MISAAPIAFYVTYIVAVLSSCRCVVEHEMELKVSYCVNKNEERDLMYLCYRRRMDVSVTSP